MLVQLSISLLLPEQCKKYRINPVLFLELVSSRNASRNDQKTDHSGDSVKPMGDGWKANG